MLLLYSQKCAHSRLNKYLYEAGISLEKEMATLSSILAWEIPWKEEAGRLQSTGLQESNMTDLNHYHRSYIIDKSGSL